MLKNSIIENVLTTALEQYADFGEIYVEQTQKNTIAMTNGIVDTALSGIDKGAGIRLFYGNQAVYAYTNDLSEKNLIEITKKASLAMKENHNAKEVFDFTKPFHTNYNKIQKMPNTIPKKQKIEVMKGASSAAFLYDTLISQTRLGYQDITQSVLIANTKGVLAKDERVRSRMTVEAIASSQTEKQSGFFGPGASMGFELFEKIDMEQVARNASRIAVTMLKADVCPRKKMTVVIENGFGGVIFHEACGHSLEATAVARNASVFAGKLGQKIASSIVTAVDDGTIENAWGTTNIDDEGIPTQKNILIENGILKSYLVDTLNGQKMNMFSTGSARRESYKFAPTSRMTNTYIAAGNTKPADIISDTEYGLYAKCMGGGSVDPATGVFNFAVLEGYMIRNGKIAEPVRGATLIGKGDEILLRIDRVGNNLKSAQGMCGSISGSIPTNVGQPMIRVSEITVGGRG
ncbi:TldD/PmbA family protein [Clostridium sp. MD294]|uniref:TldD/PmbA family protein n=1 Tax=Clostridium sp. MD294 TaxID=97138 RepID=UPI0002C94C8E|nr:TldD/PmbA family protein [Clostridium sp. MD294]NDO46442.1 TldD/PmbA family protein [Clostridium sp. MD294]USF29128.1 Metalloprotease TldD [Clostridium sp. MD294]